MPCRFHASPSNLNVPQSVPPEWNQAFFEFATERSPASRAAACAVDSSKFCTEPATETINSGCPSFQYCSMNETSTAGDVVSPTTTYSVRVSLWLCTLPSSKMVSSKESCPWYAGDPSRSAHSSRHDRCNDVSLVTSPIAATRTGCYLLDAKHLLPKTCASIIGPPRGSERLTD